MILIIHDIELLNTLWQEKRPVIESKHFPFVSTVNNGRRGLKHAFEITRFTEDFMITKGDTRLCILCM